MKKLGIALGVLAGLWLAGEIAFVPIAERQVESRVAERNRDAATVRADIDSFPMVTRLLFTGEVKEIDFTLDRVARRRLTFTEVRFELEGVEVDRGRLIRGDPRVTAIDRGTIAASIELGELGAILGRVASLVGVDVTVSGRTLVVGPARFAIPSDLIPCQPQARLEEERVVVSCTIDEFPETLLEAAQS